MKIKVSLVHSIGGVIALLGFAGIALLFISANLFKELAYSNEKEALTELIGLKVYDLLGRLEQHSAEMGSNLQQDERVREGVAQNDPVTLTRVLNDQFYQYYTTAGILKLARSYVYDKDFNLLAQSTDGYLRLSSSIQLCPEILEMAKPRTGAQRVKTIAKLCSEEGKAYHGVLVPAGGLIPNAYIMIVTDPSASLILAESDMGSLIKIAHASGEIAYASRDWPDDSVKDDFLIANYELRSGKLETVLNVSVARNLESFNKNFRQTLIISLELGGIVIIPALIIAVILLRRAIRPLNNLSKASRKLSEGNYVIIEGSAFPEIDSVVESFNRMSKNITNLIEELEEENLQRQIVEDRLRDNQAKLETARDEALVATETKSNFLANMSHEIRTPLTAIVGFSKLLLKRNMTDQDRDKTCKTVVKNAEHLLGIINDILDVSKIEANKLEIHPSEIELFPFINDIRDMVKSTIKNKPVEFDLQYNLPLPTIFVSDEMRLRQVVINLCSNAIKFTDSGNVTIRVKYDKIKNHLHIEVEDSGIGLTEEQCHKIFDAFTQADSSTTKKYGGTGLGLAISRQLVQKLGGELSVESEYGVGSVFKFFIDPGPVDVATLTNEIPNLETLDGGKSEVQQFTYAGSVLLVEDMPDNQELISCYLEEVGVDVTIANNGEEAVEKVSFSDFDLVLMDMQMPVMGGLEAVEMIRGMGINVPITMLTANAFQEDRDRSKQAGADDFLVKPVEVKELYRVLKRFLRAEEIQVDAEENSQQEQTKSESVTQQAANDTIVSSMMGKSEKMDNIVLKFVSSLPKYFGSIEEAYRAGDWERLRAELHALKGMGGSFGFPMITDCSRALETEVKAGNTQGLDPLMGHLKDTVDRIAEGMALYRKKA